MDERAVEEVTEEINPQRGVESEVDRILRRNESLQKSNSWDGATDKQLAQIRNRITSGTDHKGYKYQKNDKTFIEVDKGNYKRVTRREDVYIDERSGNVWLRDSKGRFKEVVQDE